VIRYFFRALRAQAQGGLLLFGLSLFGVSIGVASVISIQIINLNAMGAFRGSMKAVSGNADLILLGKMPSLPENVYPDVLAMPGVAAAWPLYRVDVTLIDDDPIVIEVIGIDFFGFSGIELPWEGEPVDVSEVLGRSGWVAITATLARQRGWTVGQRLRVSIGTRTAELVVGALSDFENASPLASPRLAVMDIAQAQSLLGARGELDQIDVKVHDDADVESVAAALERKLGTKALILTPEQREDQAADLLSAFRLNLTALSLISLFVGGFLVFSSTQAALVRRRTEFGLLRSLGATHRQVFGLLVGDVALLGVAGVAIGMPLGYLGARANIERISVTVSNLYLLEEIHQLVVPPWFFVLGAAVGLAGAGLGALAPALELSRKDTRSLLAAFSLHERIGEKAPRLFAAGAICVMAIVGVYLATGDRWRPAGFVQAFLLICALPLMAPWLVQLATSRVRVRSLGLAYGVKGLGKQLQTTPIAVAALAIAVSMVVGVTTMVSSFRETLDIWIERTIQADIYVSTPSRRRAGSHASIDAELIERLKAHPAVTHVDRLRQFFAYTNGRRFSFAGVDATVPVGRDRFLLLEGDVDELPRSSVLVGEPLARKQDLHVGDDLVVDGPDGPVSLPIAGIYYDYSSELGSAFVDLDTMEKHFGPGAIGSVALYLTPEADADGVVDELEQQFRETPLSMRSNRGLRERAMQVFDQTFAITSLLRYMSLLIAVCGVALTLIVLARERTSELALYRALGASRVQIFRVYLGKGLGMGAAGIALGSVAGVGFAWILIYVVNRAFFGWTIAVHWPIGLLVWQSAIVLLASGAASVYPALIASRTPATELRREDL
jgi:putative ABC transport system permease protein